MASKAQIENFFQSKTIAIAGVSRIKRKFGSQVFHDLKKKGYNVIPINPNTDNILNEKCYPDIKSINIEIDGLIIITKSKVTEQLLLQAIDKKIKNIWIQQMSDNAKVIEISKNAADLNIITNECILMHANPVNGPHRFHRFIRSLFRKYPEN